MEIEVSTVQKIRLSKLDALDPVTITLDDQGPGKGGITIGCYGRAWQAWWGDMGDRRIAEFFRSCDGDYLAEKLDAMSPEVTDYHAISEALGYCVDATTLEISAEDIEKRYGPDWRENGLPRCANPDYLYLRRIIKAAQDGLTQMAESREVPWTLDELYSRAVYCAKYSGNHMTLILPKKRPKGFPRGELMCDNGRDKVYSVSATKVLKWLKANGYPSSGNS
jgi:hypothetical protein